MTGELPISVIYVSVSDKMSYVAMHCRASCLALRATLDIRIDTPNDMLYFDASYDTTHNKKYEIFATDRYKVVTPQVLIFGLIFYLSIVAIQICFSFFLLIFSVKFRILLKGGTTKRHFYFHVSYVVSHSRVLFRMPYVVSHVASKCRVSIDVSFRVSCNILKARHTTYNMSLPGFRKNDTTLVYSLGMLKSTASRQSDIFYFNCRMS